MGSVTALKRFLFRIAELQESGYSAILIFQRLTLDFSLGKALFAVVN